ncbi:MAG: branched-chain amino acid ABC transporter permease [Armatimonadota bacterium]
MAVSWLQAFWTPPRLVAVLVMAALPVLLRGSAYHLFLVNTILIFAMLALGLQLVLGFGGILQLGYAGFFGLGAYASALIVTRLGYPFLVGFAAAVAVATLGGAIMSPIIRLRDVYFAMASFVFGLILELIFNQWSGLTNGPIGFRGIPAPSLLGFVIQRPEHYYYLLLVVLLAEYLLAFRLLHSPFGGALQAMRESEVACKTSGVNTAAVKVQLILISCAIAGGAGSLLAHMNGFISPPSFGWAQSVTVLMMVVVGGVRSLPGALLGACAIRLVLERTSILGRQSNIVFGIVLILFMAFLPHGLAGLLRRIAAAMPRMPGLKTRRLEHEPRA